MAFEASSYLHAAVKVDPDGTIISRVGIADVVRNDVGEYALTLTDGVGDNAETRGVALEGDIPGLMTVTRASPTAYLIRTWDDLDTPADRRWNLAIFALTNRS